MVSIKNAFGCCFGAGSKASGSLDHGAHEARPSRPAQSSSVLDKIRATEEMARPQQPPNCSSLSEKQPTEEFAGDFTGDISDISENSVRLDSLQESRLPDDMKALITELSSRAGGIRKLEPDNAQYVCLKMEKIMDEKNMSPEQRKAFLSELKDMSPDLESGMRSRVSEDSVPVVKGAAYSLIKEQEGLHKLEAANNAKPDNPFAAVKPEDNWKFFIDKPIGSEDVSKYSFENEAGFLGGAHSGMAKMIETLDDPLDIALFTELHDNAVDGVMERNETFPAKTLATGICGDQQVFFNMMLGSNASEEGLIELIESQAESAQGQVSVKKCAAGENPSFVKLSAEDLRSGQVTANDNIRLIRPQSAGREEIERSFSDIMKTYESAVDAAGDSEDLKLDAIAQCCRSLETEHMFDDGNARTVGGLVLNKLLAENGLSPSVFSNPNLFDGHTIEELKGEIKAGQAEFQAITQEAPTAAEAATSSHVPPSAMPSAEAVLSRFAHQ